MIFEQVIHRDLGCAGYVIGCQVAHEAVVVDPPLDVRAVLAVCARENARLVGVLETHNHADHVSGHGVLAARTGAWIAIHEGGSPEYEARLLKDGDQIDVGNIRLQTIHTPGHRPEHVCFAVSDLTRAEDPWIVLTGDSLFIGDVARPDLAVEGEVGAEGLYTSLHERLLALGDGVEVFPGHVAGSMCGRGMSARLSSTIGYERRFNPMLAEMTVKEFVERATGEAGAKPPNVARIVAINQGPLMREAPRLRSHDRIAAGSQLLDVRDGRAFARGHVPGSLNIPLTGTGFGTRAGFALDPERPVVVIADRGDDASEAQRRLGAVGFFDLVELGIGAGQAAIETFQPIALTDLLPALEQGELQVLDVREADELPELPGAVQIPYRVLRDADLSALDPERPTGVLCQSGSRTPLAASLLAARGFRRVRPVLDEGIGDVRAA